MTTKTRNTTSTGGGLSSVAGLTVPEFSVQFADFNSQWLCERSTTGSPPRWRFQGGVVYFDVLITIFVQERFRQRDDLLHLIMDHEFEHVAEQIDIVKRFMPAQMPTESIVRRYLIDQNPVDDPMFQSWFKTKRFEDYLQPTWATEHNRRGQHLDSGQGYRDYGDRIIFLEQMPEGR